MTDTKSSKRTPELGKNNNRTIKNTLKCVLALGVIAIVCVALLAVANKFLKVEVVLDKATAKLINQIAPTGVSDDEAYGGGHIKMVNLADGDYSIKSLDEFNKKGSNNQVLALYTSTHAETGNVTRVVEAQGKGRDGVIVMLVAYDAENKVSALVVKSQMESYWSHITDIEKVYAAYIGTSYSEQITSSQVAAVSGATVKVTLGGMTDAVNTASEFIAKIHGIDVDAPTAVTDSEILENLRKVSDATAFTRYNVGESGVNCVYLGNNGDTVFEATGTAGENKKYGNVTMLVNIKNNTVVKVTLTEYSFVPTPPKFDSSPLLDGNTLNEIFAGLKLSDVSALDNKNLAGTTGVTQSCSGLIDAVKNALTYAPRFTQRRA